MISSSVFIDLKMEVDASLPAYFAGISYMSDKLTFDNLIIDIEIGVHFTKMGIAREDSRSIWQVMLNYNMISPVALLIFAFPVRVPVL